MKDLFILGAAVASEASETMVELCFWPSIVLVRKLAIYCDYLGHSTYDGFLCARATKEGQNVKSAVIPSKSHSAAVLIRNSMPSFILCFALFTMIPPLPYSPGHKHHRGISTTH
jgi:hypothetical protein